MVQTLGKDVYDAWAFEWQDSGRNYSGETVFFEGNTIYSYGKHFPMAIRQESDSVGTWYLVNADTYSSTTNKHQAGVRSAISGKPQMQIPFSALSAAGIDVQQLKQIEFELIDNEDDRDIPVVRRDPKTGEKYDTTIHLMGASLFSCYGWKEIAIVDEYPTEDLGEGKRANSVYTRDGWKYSVQQREKGYFLGGLDETGRDPWRSFFLAELDVADHVPSTVEEAYASLKPEEVLKAEEDGDIVIRQGEWFFVEVTDEEEVALNRTEKDAKKRMLEGMDLLVEPETTESPRWAYGSKFLLENKDPEREKRHLVTKYIQVGDTRFAKGTCRHTGGDHKMLKLPKWHRVYENVQQNSWVAAGRID